MVNVMNRRATLLADGGSWPRNSERDFQELVRWTKNVTPEELALFNDPVGDHPYKKMYLRLPHDE